MKNTPLALAAAAAGATLCGVIESSAHAAVIAPGLYVIHNHGASEPSRWGLRLDELYDVATFQDIFVFDFDHPSSLMTIEITAGTIRVSGQTWGGRWFHTALLDDEYRGVYTIDFLFNNGVMQAPGDDDFIVDAVNNSNHGLISTPLGHTIDLYDERGGSPFSFRLGNEDHDAGHRGYVGISGWGWVNHGDDPAHHISVGDWLFTVGPLIPSQGSAATVIAGLVLLAVRRRR